MKAFTFSMYANKVRGALIFAAKGDIRYYLNGVHFRRQGKGVVAVATDGHRLTAIYEETALQGLGVDPETSEPIQAPESFEIIIEGDALARAAKAHKVAGVPLVFQVGEKPEEGPRKVRILVDGGSTVIECAEIEGKFPDFQRVIPPHVHRDPRREFAVAGFNAAYMADYLKLSKALTPGANATHGIIVYSNGDSSAVVDIGHEDALCVLMPMRMGDVSRWEWYYGPEPEAKPDPVEEAPAAAAALAEFNQAHPEIAYANRVAELERDGLCTSDAQAAADAEFSDAGLQREAA
jgi:DNA polymerase-3 subunit beta